MSFLFVLFSELLKVCFCNLTLLFLSHLFEGALHIDALVPRRGGVGEAVSSIPSSGDVHFLTPQVPEGLGHHHHAIVRQR